MSLRLVFPRVPASDEPVEGVSTRDVVVGAESNIWSRLFIPIQAQKDVQHGRTFPVVVFFHGGGFVALHPDTSYYDQFCRKIAREIEVPGVYQTLLVASLHNIEMVTPHSAGDCPIC